MKNILLLFLFYLTRFQLCDELISNDWIDVFDISDQPITADRVTPIVHDTSFSELHAINRYVISIFESVTTPLNGYRWESSVESSNATFVEQLELDSKRMSVILNTLNQTLSIRSNLTVKQLMKSLNEVHTLCNDGIYHRKKISIRKLTRSTGKEFFNFAVDILGNSRNFIAPMLVVLVSFLMVRLASTFGVKQFLNRFFVTAFISSVFWNWYNLYLKAVARNRAEIMQTIGTDNGCLLQSGTITATIYRAMSGIFVSHNLRCQRYYEALLVAPISEVSPTQALSITVVKFFIEPAQLIGEAIAKLIVGSQHNLPVMLQPLSIVLAMVFVILLLVFLFGFSIHTPFFSIQRPAQAFRSLPIDQSVEPCAYLNESSLAPTIHPLLFQNSLKRRKKIRVLNRRRLSSNLIRRSSSSHIQERSKFAVMERASPLTTSNCHSSSSDKCTE